MTQSRRPVALCILDGWGLSATRKANAVALAATPHFDRLMADCPNARLSCCGEDVGLPVGQMGNSEVGHMNIGAGRVVMMDLPRIDRAISDGSFAAHDRLAAFAEAAKGTAHIMGLVSDGGVHAHSRHMAAAARAVEAAGAPVRLHLFLDGRDVGPKTGETHLAALRDALADSAAEIATVTGRFHAMDRDRRWDRTEAAYDAIVNAEGARADSAEAAIAAAYGRGETDEFVSPTVIGLYDGVVAGDALFFVNFRADRARQILSALADPDFDGFARTLPDWSATLGMVEYSDRLAERIPPLFPAEEIVNTLGRWVSSHGLTQLRLAETEKYPHVTFFLNGGIEPADAGETRIMPDSPKVRTYDLAPEMSAEAVTAALVEGIGAGYDLIVVNYANPDMVGHTGDLDAAIRACEATDLGLGAALAALEGAGGAMIVTADHGNCETMTDPETGGAHTAHTTNPVPVILAGGPEGARLRDGRLADLAPTLLALLGLTAPAEMTGRSLIAHSA